MKHPNVTWEVTLCQCDVGDVGTCSVWLSLASTGVFECFGHVSGMSRLDLEQKATRSSRKNEL